MKSGERPIVVVLLGMHRSGTSLTMSVLNALGVECGDTLIPPGRGNVAGFWENAEVVAVQEHLLAALDRVWHGPKGTFPLPEMWLQSEAAVHAKQRLVQILEKEASQASPIWGFKDPRTCRLLPLWREVFSEMDIAPIYILSIRHPSAVTASLARHNGMSLHRGRLVWLVHNLDAVRHCGDELLAIVDYDRLVEHAASEVDRLAEALGGFMKISTEQKANAIRRVSPDLRSHSTKTEPIGNAILRDIYQELLTNLRGGSRSESIVQVAERWPDLEDLFQAWREDKRPLFLDWAIRFVLRRKYG